MPDAVWVTVGTNAVVLLAGLWIASIRMTLKVTTIKNDIDRAIAAIKTDTSSIIDEHTLTNLEEFARVRREFGETVAALREKVNADALYAAKEYMHRDGFSAVKQDIESSMIAMGERLEKRLERMEIKLDSKT